MRTLPAECRALSCLLAAAFFSSCSDSSTNPDDSCNIIDLTLIGPETMEVGQSVRLEPDIVQGPGGNCPSNRLVGNWTSSNPDVVEIHINPGGQALLRADLIGTAEITVSLMGMTSSITVEVIPPAVPSGIAYGLVDQTGAADNAYAFNNLGAPLTAIRTATGRYRVTVPGFMGGPDEDRVAFANAVNGQNAICVATEWTMIGDVAGGNATVDVACSTITGTAMDSDFVIFLIGQHGLPGYYAIGYSGTVAGLPEINFVRPFPGNSSWSRLGTVRLVRFAEQPLSRFSIWATALPPNPEVGYAVIQSPAGSVDSRCNLLSFGISTDIVCRPPGGNGYSPEPFSWMIFDEGRSGVRVGTAWANNPGAASYAPSVLARRNSSGGDIAITRSDAGTYEVQFAGLGRTDPGRREVVMVSTLERDGGEHCKVAEPWSTGVSTDLTVQVRCVNGAGDPADAAFFIVVLE